MPRCWGSLEEYEARTERGHARYTGPPMLPPGAYPGVARAIPKRNNC